MAHAGVSPIPVPPGAGGWSLSLVTGRPWRTKGAFFTRTGQSTPARLGTAAGAPGAGRHRRFPVPGRQQPQHPSRPPQSLPEPAEAARWWGAEPLPPPRPAVSSPGCSRLPKTGGRSRSRCRSSPGVPVPKSQPARTLSARRTIGRRSTEPPKPMDQKLQLRHAEKNIPRAARAVFCLLQIPEPDPFSLWV